MGRGCLCSEGRIVETTNATANDRYGHEDYRETQKEQKHLCWRKLVDEDIPRGKCIRRCDTCGKIYCAEK